MISERWEKIEELLHEALALAPEERSAFLLHECAEDEPLRSEVESLLTHHALATSFLEIPLPEIAAELLTQDRTLLATGQSIGNYKIIGPLGVGGMAEVYLAKDTRLERRVALKILPDSYTRDSAQSLRFEQEARAVAALNHPNIVTIHEIAQMDNTRFIVTEFVEGHTLSQRMAFEKMTLTEILDVAIQTATALDCAHEAGIIHRDVKPANIMLRQDGLIKVLDFGLAKFVGFPPSLDCERQRFRTNSDVILGTLHYMSPEQIRCQDLDARTDIFSLGVVVYEMVAGCLPFDGATPGDVIAAILACQPPPLSGFAPDIPSKLEQIVGKALAKDKQKRYSNIRGLLSDMRDLRQELGHEKSKRQRQDESPDLIREGKVSEPAEPDAAWPGALLPAPDNTTAKMTGTSGGTLQTGQERIRHYGRVAMISFLSLVVWIAAFGYAKRESGIFRPATDKIQRIAVLPLENLSGDPQQDYFAEGLTDDLITVLGQIKALKVISRTSVMIYKGSQKPLPEIARELNVNYVIEASTVRSANRVRINVRLIDVVTGLPRWSESYQRDIGNILMLQDEVARDIAREVSVNLSPQEEAQFNRKDTINPEAYDAYNMGQFHFNKRTAAGYQASIKYYEQSIAKDPNYALAYAGLAFTYILGAYSVAADLPQEEAITKAKLAAKKALELDAMQAQAHAALGLILYWHDYDLVGAEKELRQAIELNPNYSEGYLRYAQYLAGMGRNIEAHDKFETAYLLNPMSPGVVMNYALSWAREGNFDQAIEMHRRSIELSGSEQWNTYLWMGSTYEQMGRYPEAIAEFQKALEISEGAASPRACLGHAYAMSGRRVEAEKILNDIRIDGDKFLLAYICTGLGRKDEAISLLEKLYEGDRAGLFLLKTQWAWDPLRSDPRFQRLLQRLGLPPDRIKH